MQARWEGEDHQRVEHDEDERHQVEAHRELDPGAADGRLAALVNGQPVLLEIRALHAHAVRRRRPDQAAEYQVEEEEEHPHRQEHEHEENERGHSSYLRDPPLAA